MKRRIGSLFYKSKPRTEEIRAKRWSIPYILGRIIKKTCMAIGGLVLFSIVMGLIVGVFMGDSKKTLPDDMILVLNIIDPVGESERSRSLADPLAATGITIQNLVSTLDRAATDKRVRGLLVSLDNGGMELAHIQEARAAVKRFRAAGKFAHIYTSSFADLGSGIGAYYFASAFDQIWMQPVGMVAITGLALEMPFAKKTLDKIGANPQFLHREEYKSAMESFTNETMSAPNREMMTSILDDLSKQIFNDIAEDRKMKPAFLQVQIDNGLITGADALKAGLIDRIGYTDELIDTVREKITGQKKSEEPPLVIAEDYSDATSPSKKMRKHANVAIVNIAGEIVPGSEPEPGRATGDYIAAAIQSAAEDEKIKVIVVRVNSPGGSPSASETIRHAIVNAKEEGKKVIVSMGPLAASGGYWVAVDADKIYAMPSTLTGSIGVIMGKFELSGLWEKIGVNWDAITWGKNSRMWSANTSLTESQKKTLDAAIDNTYMSFIDRVAEGRKMDKEKVRSLAKGRAWTGLQAKQNGLVDEIGGLDSALDDAAKIVGVANRSKLNIVVLPEPLTAFEELMRLMGSQVGLGNFMDLSFVKSIAPYADSISAMERMGPIQAYDPATMGVRP